MINNRSLELRSRLLKKPVIAGLRTQDDVDLAQKAGIQVCFYLTGDIFQLRELVKITKRNNQLLLVHVDLIGGVARDSWGIQLLAEEVGIDGILTTKTQLVREAKNLGLLAIQRLFMLDSEALRTGLRILESSSPDAVEILPALILPNICRRLPKKIPPIIGGGLIETMDELSTVLTDPVLAVSTSKNQLWSYQRRP